VLTDLIIRLVQCRTTTLTATIILELFQDDRDLLNTESELDAKLHQLYDFMMNFSLTVDKPPNLPLTVDKPHDEFAAYCC